MSDVAQKRDIGDPRTVAQFAEIVGTSSGLRLLLVLTVSDIRAVGPSIVWNDWKGSCCATFIGSPKRRCTAADPTRSWRARPLG